MAVCRAHESWNCRLAKGQNCKVSRLCLETTHTLQNGTTVKLYFLSAVMLGIRLPIFCVVLRAIFSVLLYSVLSQSTAFYGQCC